MRFLSSLLLLVVLPLQQSAAFDYIFVEEPEEPAIVLTDVETGISEIKTIFLNELVGVTATGIEWEALEDGETVPDVALWENSVDGTVQASGELNLTDVGRVLPDELDAGEIKISSRGRHKIVVTLALNGTSFFEASGEYEAYAAGVSIIPLIVVLIMAASTRMVSHMSTGVLVVVLLTEILNITPLRTLTVSSSTKLLVFLHHACWWPSVSHFFLLSFLLRISTCRSNFPCSLLFSSEHAWSLEASRAGSWKPSMTTFCWHWRMKIMDTSTFLHFSSLVWSE